MIYNTLYNLLLEEFSPEVKDFLAKYREHRKIASNYQQKRKKWWHKHKTSWERDRTIIPPGNRLGRLSVALDKSLYNKVFPAYDRIKRNPEREKERSSRPEGYRSSLKER